MVDPDAPSRDDAVKGPVIHWLVANFQAEDLKDGRTLCKSSFQIFFFLSIEKSFFVLNRFVQRTFTSNWFRSASIHLLPLSID